MSIVTFNMREVTHIDLKTILLDDEKPLKIFSHFN